MPHKPTATGELTCAKGCGKTFIRPGAWKSKHEAKCAGAS